MLARVARYLATLQQYADRPWYLPIVAIIVALDLFVLIIPSDGLLVSSVLLRPKRWLRTAIWVSTGSSLGALVLAAIIHWDSTYIMETFPFLFQSQGWDQTETFIAEHGAWALAFIAFSIFPQQPAVVIVALGKMPLATIFISVWVGRVVKYVLLAAAAAYAPAYLGRIWFVRKELEDMKRIWSLKNAKPAEGTTTASKPTA